MKNLVFVFLPFVLFCQEETYPKEFRIGAHSFVMTITQGYNHDDRANSTFFVVYNKRNKNRQISAYKTVERNGRLTATGRYRVEKKFIEFTEIQGGDPMDSMTKRFYPNKYGNLILTEFTHFKNGVAKRTRL